MMAMGKAESYHLTCGPMSLFTKTYLGFFTGSLERAGSPFDAGSDLLISLMGGGSGALV